MTKEQIKEKAERMIEAQMDESGLEREEVLEVSALCFLEEYIHDDISEEELIALDDYLQVTIDLKEARSLKAKRKKQAEYRLNAKAKRMLAKKRGIIVHKLGLSGEELEKEVISSLRRDYSSGKMQEELLPIIEKLIGAKLK